MSIDPHGVRARAVALSAARGWFHGRGYLEVVTPAIVPSPALEEHLFALPAGRGYLRTSPEFALKRVIAAGLPRIYEIGPCFRDRERGDWHGTEFLMLEWYRVGGGLPDLMDEVEDLVATCARALGASPPPAWRRVSVRDLFREHVGVDLAAASPREISAEDDTFEDAFFRRWVSTVEPALTAPTFVTDWPAPMAALSQVRTDGDWPRAQRFEAYLSGVELANAFLEVIDGEDQRRRFVTANAARDRSGEPPHPVDDAFVQAVGKMPPTVGIALGFDRLVAALLGWDGIGRGRVGHPAFLA